MSLKAFHLVFITLSVLLALGFAAWCFVEYREGRAGTYALTGIASVAASVGLTYYGVRFARNVRKLRSQ